MTAELAQPLKMHNVDYTDPSNVDRFFSRGDVEKIKSNLIRESAPIGECGSQCKPNLFFGFFHDGTRNNYGKSIEKKNHTHSNIARLYSCYPGKSVPNVIPNEPKWEHEISQFENFFRVYTPGVSSLFDAVDDTGEGKDATLGAAMAYKGEPRIVWTLLQAINNVHRFFKKDKKLIEDDEAKKLYSRIRLNKLSLDDMTAWTPSAEHGAARMQFESILKRLHDAIQYNMTGPDGSKPRNTDPGWVQQIYVSAFGFSRGAAAARVFANWLVALCKLDAMLLKKPYPTLGGFAVNFEFLGLFDTVASVGLANTLNTADGHWGWADAEVSLRVPREFSECLHLVSAHEVRRSFPLDSISVDGVLGSRRYEIVYPGVHSDVGGGYCPKEQGKGKDETGMDMLSRLPLAHMYRAARLAGVPLKLELVTQQSVKEDFKIAPATIAAFNHYQAFARTKNGRLTDIMREQRNFYIQWRYKRRHQGPTPLEETGSFNAAIPVDQNDLHSANVEFTLEMAAFERWRDNYLHPMPQEDRPYTWEHQPHKPKGIKPQQPGFENDWHREWEEIARFWESEFLPEGIAAFFDDYVHDSRAWFKLSGPEADEVEGVLKTWLRQIKEFEEAKHDSSNRVHLSLTTSQKNWALEYERTGRVPRMINSGREPLWSGAGYLRYRKVYAGGDAMLISEGGQSVSGVKIVSNRRHAAAEAA
ncbi:T6SS phospholipase effector Tle1-like catalytic domain-containing protein [Noviherbaspirillum sp. ST9]|uniref:T6SS phospholipase effector Tle1-like catalytic domain-containing protein n=1 Tax=Noviherbaspirillum sp. ST9 TaxID=3401606 RepID=UPI003B58A32F